MTTDIRSFSQALTILEAHGVALEALGADEKTKKLVYRVGTIEYDKGGVIALAKELAASDQAVPAALSPLLQEIARQYVAARRKSGEALLDMAKHLTAAREACEHGEWGRFLEATQTSDDWAERLLNIHQAAERDPRFAEAVRTNFLSPTVAGLLSRESTPPAIVDQALSAAEPPTTRQIEKSYAHSKSAAMRNLKQSSRLLKSSPMPAPASKRTAIGLPTAERGAMRCFRRAAHRALRICSGTPSRIA